jgi:hypothetical protein
MRYVYVLRNLINGKVYVGQTKNPVARKAGHFYGAKKCHDRPLYRSIRKHGAENFSFEVIEECDDTVINEREQFWVAHFDSFNPEKGYNLTSGGNQHYLVSEETKQRLRRNHVGMKNKRHSLETIRKMRIAHLGRKHSEATKVKLRQRKISFEIREKISKTLKGKFCGENSPNFGTKRSIESKLKMSQAHKRNPELRRKIARIAGQASAMKSRIELSPEVVELILQVSSHMSIRAIARKLGINNRKLITNIIRSSR